MLLYHVGVPPFTGGYIGVDVFFVLSGFLITNHLLAEVSSTGRIRFGRFYARRARRLLPASLAVLLATAVVGGLFLPSVLFREFVDDLVAAVLYVPNILLAVQGADYLSESAPSPVQHYWSLGVEEQFYLVWPPLLLVILALTAFRLRRVAVVLGLGIVVSLSASIVLTFVNQPWAFFSPFTRAWELGVGALVALALTTRWAWGPVVSAVIAWSGLAAVVVGAVVLTSATPFPGVAALIPVGGTAAVLLAAPHAGRAGPLALLSVRPLQFLGRISYALYLVHWPLLVLPPLIDPTGEPLCLAARVGLGCLSVALAWLVHRGIERPMLDREWARSLTPPRVGVLAATAMAIVLVSTAGLASLSAQRPLATSTVADPVNPGADALVFSPVVPSNLRPRLDEASGDLPAVYADGCHLPLDVDVPLDCVYGDDDASIDIVLLGDSHAAQWFPAILAFPEAVRLQTHTKSSCPAFDVTMVTNGVLDSGCAEWRDEVISSIEADPPDVVIMSGFAHYDDYGSPGITSEVWSAAVERTVARVEAVTDVVVITDTPRFLRSPSICLSATVSDAFRCSRLRSAALDTAWGAAERSAAERAGGSVIVLNDLLCDPEWCGTIIGDVLLYRDEHHLSATMAAQLGPALAVAMAVALPETFGRSASGDDQ